MVFRHPALHFIALGAVLFALAQWRNSWAVPEEAVRPPIVIELEQQQQLRSDFARQSGRSPTGAQEQALIQGLVDDEILYREALALGLDRFDPSVRFRLAQKMKFLRAEEASGNEDDLASVRQARELGLDRDDIVIRRILVQKMKLLIKAGLPEPTLDELEDYFGKNRDAYLQPPTRTFSQVFFSSDLRGARLRSDAQRVREELIASAASASEAAGRGDPLPVDSRMRGASPRSVAKIFGGDFAEAVFRVEAGRWSEPLESVYGLHLVWVEQKREASWPPLSAVQSQVEQRLRAERAQQRLADRIDELRGLYEVHVESETGS